MTKILIAEDEPDIRDLVAFTLRFAGYEVVTGTNGEEAVQIAKKELPDLILLDMKPVNILRRIPTLKMCRLCFYQPKVRNLRFKAAWRLAPRNTC